MSRTKELPEPRPTAPFPDLPHAARHGFHHEMGFKIDIERSGRGMCTVIGQVEPRHLNINSVVHGGVYATILDTAMGAAVLSVLGAGETAATTSLYVEFLRAAREGDTLTARGEVLRRGRHLAFAEGNLYGQDGRRLSQARGTWYIWSIENGSRAARAGPKRRRAGGSRRRSAQR
ncbi:MAG TPA: PaaI family thioesterase [Thermoplasmata archaeon]|nr:PaaI family thioesterase [Thermoplasmata archaeon]